MGKPPACCREYFHGTALYHLTAWLVGAGDGMFGFGKGEILEGVAGS